MKYLQASAQGSMIALPRQIWTDYGSDQRSRELQGHYETYIVGIAADCGLGAFRRYFPCVESWSAKR